MKLRYQFLLVKLICSLMVVFLWATVTISVHKYFSTNQGLLGGFILGFLVAIGLACVILIFWIRRSIKIYGVKAVDDWRKFDVAQNSAVDKLIKSLLK
jgi:uncharacterized membrane protein